MARIASGLKTESSKVEDDINRHYRKRLGQSYDFVNFAGSSLDIGSGKSQEITAGDTKGSPTGSRTQTEDGEKTKSVAISEVNVDPNLALQMYETFVHCQSQLHESMPCRNYRSLLREKVDENTDFKHDLSSPEAVTYKRLFLEKSAQAAK